MLFILQKLNYASLASGTTLNAFNKQCKFSDNNNGSLVSTYDLPLFNVYYTTNNNTIQKKTHCYSVMGYLIDTKQYLPGNPVRRREIR